MNIHYDSLLGKCLVLITVAMFSVQGLAWAESYKRYNLTHGVSVEIPLGWKILDTAYYRQLDNATEAKTKIDQSNNEIIIAANCYLSNKKAVATFRISFRKKKPELSQDYLKHITSAELNYFLSEFIAASKKIDERMRTRTDPTTQKVIISDVGGLLALTHIKEIEIRGKTEKQYLYFIPVRTGLFKVQTSCNKNEESLLGDILTYMVSSICFQ